MKSFGAHAALAGKCGHIAPPGRERHAERRAPRAHELLVPVALGAAYHVVEVGTLDVVSELEQQVQHGDAVRPAGLTATRATTAGS